MNAITHSLTLALLAGVVLLAHNVKHHALTKRALTLEIVVEMYLTVIGLMKNFEQNKMLHYSKFFDEELMREARLMFRRLYGFAQNETQGIEWEAAAVKHLTLYVIHIGAAQANAYDEKHAQLYDRNRTQPCELRLLCVSKVRAEMMSYLSYDFRYPDVADPVLLYELMSFSKLPVTVTGLDTPPYLKIRLVNSNGRAQSIGNVPKANLRDAPVHRALLPFSPIENFANEIEIFLRAQSATKEIFNILPLNSTYLRNFIDAQIFSKTTDFVESMSKKYEELSLVMRAIHAHALLQYFVDYLYVEFNRLMCHPILERIGNYATINKSLDTMSRKQEHINMRFNHIKLFIFTEIGCPIVSGAQNRLHELLQCMNPIVSLQNANGIALVKNSNI